MTKRILLFFGALLLALLSGAGVFFFLNSATSGNSGITQALSNIPGIQAIQQSSHLPTPLRGGNAAVDTTLTVDGVIAETNAQRTTEGRKPLKVNTQLTEAAQSKLNDMFTDQYFEHVAPTGEEPAFWIELSGYSFVSTGENLAEGNFEGDAALVQAWMDSPGHRENILNEKFEEIGIAVGQGQFQGKTTWLAVQMFGRPVSSCPAIDDGLKALIDESQKEINDLQSQLDILSKRLEDEKPESDANRQEINKYNSLVAQYNRLANEYNELAESTQQTVTKYNSQVQAFNACAQE